MAVLMTVQPRFLWWPFHPLGYPISVSGAGAEVGDPEVRRPGALPAAAPLLLGLILGEASVGGFWIAIDYFTGMESNTLRGIYFG